MTAPAAARDGRIDALDTLRGVAILMVIASHYLPAQLSLPAATPHLEAIGRGGVILFFLLSGYLIFRNLERQPLPAFMLRRLFKILPSYWLNLGTFLALDLCVIGTQHFPAINYAADFFMISDALRLPSVSGVYWTLLIEIKFYLFIALQYALLGGRFMPGVVAGLMSASLIALAVWGHAPAILAFFPVFYIGIFIHRAEQAGWSRKSTVALTLVTGAVAASMPIIVDISPYWSALYVAAGTALFVLCHRRQFGTRALGFVGRTSYSNYLFHGVVAGPLWAALSLPSSIWGAVLNIAAATAVTMAVATVLYAAVEVPMVRFGRWQERLLVRDRPALSGVPAVP